MLKRQGIQRLLRPETPDLYTKKELDAIRYFNGTGFYSYYQDLRTPPNIYDTRLSFLLKIKKNEKMRENFLRNYNRRKS